MTSIPPQKKMCVDLCYVRKHSNQGRRVLICARKNCGLKDKNRSGELHFKIR